MVVEKRGKLQRCQISWFDRYRFGQKFACRKYRAFVPKITRQCYRCEGKVPLDNIAKRAVAYKQKERVTYKMIKEYIEAKYGFKAHTAYIAEVKRELGLPMYDAPNAVEELKQPRKHPTAEKVEAIRDALRCFEVIQLVLQNIRKINR